MHLESTCQSQLLTKNSLERSLSWLIADTTERKNNTHFCTIVGNLVICLTLSLQPPKLGQISFSERVLVDVCNSECKE